MHGVLSSRNEKKFVGFVFQVSGSGSSFVMSVEGIHSLNSPPEAETRWSSFNLAAMRGFPRRSFPPHAMGAPCLAGVPIAVLRVKEKAVGRESNPDDC